ncbi:beta-glucosidase-related glycosidase [Neocallimastix californiae]|uniref:beta-glucosidase n=1 Tax=Neocallimastix californiae TaxID=1754190 RepID=A0A1Y2DWN1_9FUNG|nr:beta-glucosidase-related glycosidase [Neocallimastix californiae]|eukprot:ORY63609.1 beta-glucosidase-related glycosidase [Neocallimastix californiae]
MKFFNLIVFSLLFYNLILASPIKKKCYAKNKKNAAENSENSEVSEKMNQYEIDHINTLDSYLSECTILLRKNGDFPIGKSTKQVYLYGNGVRKTIKGGTGSGDVYSRSFDTIEQAFTKAGFEILSKDYLDEYDKIYTKAKDEFRKKVQSEVTDPMSLMGVIMPEPDYDIPYAKEGDLAIYVLARISGEGSDRQAVKGDVYLTETERKMILDLAKGFKKFMLVLNTGGAVDLSGIDEVENILLLSQLGVNTSKTLVDIITGDKYPSGKLTTTWTKYEDYPSNDNFGDNDDTDYKEGIYVGYRYFDTENIDVMYPFGFGLGYTDFEFDVKSAKLSGEKFEVKASVTNVGKYKGKEVLEVYLSKPGTTIDEPYQILVGFAKSKELSPKKKDDLKINFKLSDFASYDAKTATYFLDEGEYVVRIGNSSRNTVPCGVIKVDKRINVKKVENKMGKPEFEDYVPEGKRKQEDLSGVKVFKLKASSIKEKVVKYNDKYEISEGVKALSNEEKAKLVIGAFQDGPASVIGSASITAAGAAGETAKVADLKPVIMADGPAGLRLAKDYFIDEYGAHSTSGSMAESMVEFVPDEIKAMLISKPEIPEGTEILHQYTTAIPIGTAIAQSWNRKFAELCGDIVGSEMELFKVQLWLAPALNIHRSILCGRNFEYYSEDPLISGAFAASITKGVQKHNNTFVTIKHYAANNQETNRYLNSSNVSERALREIYLKGFEIAVRESQPKAVMTSYNLINGVHTSESKELTNDILRNEFGFEGIVMTDWVVGLGGNHKYSGPTPYNVIKATGDIYMPGSKADYEAVLKALKEGTLSIEELEMSASRIYNLSKEIFN